MTFDQETYTFNIKLPKSTFTDLYMQGLLDEFDSIEDGLVDLINEYAKYLNSEQKMIQDSFHQEIESIVSYSRVLAFIQRHLDKVQCNMSLFFSQLIKMNGKTHLNQYIKGEITRGKILRFLKSNSAKQLSEDVLRNIFHWSVTKFPTNNILIIQSYVEKSCARTQAKFEKTHNPAEA